MATVTVRGRSYEVEVRGDTVVVDGNEYPVSVRDEGEYTTVTVGSVPYRVQLPPPDERTSGMNVDVDYRPFTVEFEGQLAPGAGRRAPRSGGALAAGAGAAAAPAKGAIVAQLSGRVLSIKVAVGDAVSKGDVLLILEAMKMENEIKAAGDGVIKEIPVAEGAQVREGQALIVVE